MSTQRGVTARAIGRSPGGRGLRTHFHCVWHRLSAHRGVCGGRGVRGGGLVKYSTDGRRARSVLNKRSSKYSSRREGTFGVADASGSLRPTAHTCTLLSGPRGDKERRRRGDQEDVAEFSHGVVAGRSEGATNRNVPLSETHANHANLCCVWRK